MAFATPSVAAVLEIGRASNGEVPKSLISAAYRASRSAPVMLVLDSVSPTEVNRVLDPIVAEYGYRHTGVRYVSMRDETAVISSASGAARVFAASEKFRAKLASLGIGFSDVSVAESVLDVAAADTAKP